MGFFSRLFGGGPSAKKIAREAEAAAKKERERITLEAAQSAANERQLQQDSLATAEADRGKVTPIEEDETQRRKFLRGV